MAHVVNPSPEFWHGKRVLVTGHTGFKGAWLSLWLHRLGALPFGFALAPDTDPNLSVLAGLDQRFQSVRGDIRDCAAVHDATVRFAPDIIFHMAAQPLVRHSYGEPVWTFETNVMGTINILEAVRGTSSVRVAVVVTSDKCYENKEWLWAYREDDALGGHDPYSASKACAEIAVAAWRRSFLSKPGSDRPVSVSSVRAGNVIGGGDWAADRLIPDCVRAFGAERAVTIRNPSATRPWQHVLEPLCGYLLVAECLWRDGAAVAEAWNFGPGPDDVMPVSWVVSEAVAQWGDNAHWVPAGGDHFHEAGILAVDAAKARARLGWKPRLRLKDALGWTIEWYKRQRGGEPAYRLVVEQIDRYNGLEAG
jgi:CDP-glucose 4,6-dehydratase